MGQKLNVLACGGKSYDMEDMRKLDELHNYADDCIKYVKRFEEKLQSEINSSKPRTYTEEGKRLVQMLVEDGNSIIQICNTLRNKIEKSFFEGKYRKLSPLPTKNKGEHEATATTKRNPSENDYQQQSDGHQIIQKTVIHEAVEDSDDKNQQGRNEGIKRREREKKNANLQVSDSSDSDNDEVDDETLKSQKKEPYSEEINTSKEMSETNKDEQINYLTPELHKPQMELRDTGNEPREPKTEKELTETKTEKEPRETKTIKERRETKTELKETKKQLEETKKVLKETKNKLTETKKELASLQQRHDAGKGKSKSKKMGYVQILDKGSGSLGKDAIKELKTLLCGTLNTETFQLGVIHCSEPSRVDYEIPLLVICFDTSRIGTDVLKAIDGINDFDKTMVLVFHHTKKQVYPTEQDLKDTKLLNLKGRIHDFAFYEGEGVYVCDTNDASRTHVVGFIRDYYDNIVRP